MVSYEVGDVLLLYQVKVRFHMLLDAIKRLYWIIDTLHHNDVNCLHVTPQQWLAGQCFRAVVVCMCCTHAH